MGQLRAEIDTFSLFKCLINAYLITFPINLNDAVIKEVLTSKAAAIGQ